MQPAHPPRRWRVGAFEVDGPNHRLLRDGKPVALTHKPFALLCTLLERQGELVSKDAVFAAVWPQRVVSDAALSRAVHALRRAFADDVSAPRFLATVHGLGFRWIAPAQRLDGKPEAVDAPPLSPPAPAVAARSALLGRERELAQLGAAWQAAVAGERGLLLVSGESGIGKTALLEAFVASLAPGHGRVARGRCIEQYGQREAFLPWLEVLEQLARGSDASSVRALLAQRAPGWLAQLPRPASTEPVPALGPVEANAPAHVPPLGRPLLRELALALEGLSQQRPLLLWLEDLHWSDASSLDALAYLMGRRGDRDERAALLVVATLRPPEHADGAAPGSAAPLARLLDRLVQLGQARELVLPRLSAAATHALVRQLLGAAPPAPAACEAFASAVHARSEGHALYTLALVQDWLQGHTPATGADAPIPPQLPPSLRRLLRAEVERLSAADRMLLEAAAVAGTRFAAAAVAAALACTTMRAEERLAGLARRGLLLAEPEAARWPDGTLSGHYRFTHALRWQAAWEAVPPARLACWQGRIAERMLAAHAGDPAAAARLASELATRFDQAGQIRRCLEQVHAASAAALRRGAYPESIALLRQGLSLLPRCAAAERARHELDLRLPLGVALMAAQGYAAPEVEQTYQRALALCARHGTPLDWLRTLRGLWNVRFLRGELAAARDAAERLLVQALAEGDEGQGFDAHTKLGQTCLHQGELAAARRHLEAALAWPGSAADESGRRALPRVAAYLAYAAWYAGDDAAAAAACTRALQAAEAADSPHSSAFALGYVAWVKLMDGALDAADALAARQLLLSRRHGLSYWRQLALFIQGAVLARRDGTPEAMGTAQGIETMRGAIRDMQADGGEVGVPYLQCVLAESLAAAGHGDEAAALLRLALRSMRRNGNLLHVADAWRLLAPLAARSGGGHGSRRAARCLALAQATARKQGAWALARRAGSSLVAHRPG